MSDTRGLKIVDIDRDALRALELTGQLCFHCPLVEDARLPDTRPAGLPAVSGPAGCRIRAADLEPLATDPRSGIKVATRDGHVVGYSVFGRPALFRNIDDFPFEVDPDLLLVGALYVTPEARGENTDIDLLVATMDFAREHGYQDVAAVCRPDSEEGPEARAPMLGAAGFSLSEVIDGLCLAQTTLEQWDSTGEAEEET